VKKHAGTEIYSTWKMYA